MADFNKGGRRGGGGGRSGGGYRGGRDGGFNRRNSGPREMHSAVCDNCGKDCQVPFKPSGERPVLCSNCFEKKNDRGDRRGGSRGRGDRPAPRQPSEDLNKQVLGQLVLLNSKLDKILSALNPVQESKKKPEVAETKKTAGVKKETGPKADKKSKGEVKETKSKTAGKSKKKSS